MRNLLFNLITTTPSLVKMLWWRSEGKLTYCNFGGVVEGLRKNQKNPRHAKKAPLKRFQTTIWQIWCNSKLRLYVFGSEDTSRLERYAVLTSTSRLRRHDSQCEGVMILQNLQEHRWESLTSRKFRDNWGKLFRIICFRLSIRGAFRRRGWLKFAFQGCSCT